MKISTKGRYGTRALLDIALCQDKSPVPLKKIAQRQEIPLHYLERIVALLVRTGLLKSIRGPSGGVMLHKSPGEIRISEVIQILEGSMAPVECVDDPGVCSRVDFCVMCDVWTETKEAVAEVLESVTLQDLVERHYQKTKS